MSCNIDYSYIWPYLLAEQPELSSEAHDTRQPSRAVEGSGLAPKELAALHHAVARHPDVGYPSETVACESEDGGAAKLAAVTGAEEGTHISPRVRSKRSHPTRHINPLSTFLCGSLCGLTPVRRATQPSRGTMRAFAQRRFASSTAGKPLFQIPLQPRVTVGKNRKVLLRDFQLSIHPGERWAIVGPNGAGKSTTAQLIGSHFCGGAGDAEPFATIAFESHRTLLQKELREYYESRADVTRLRATLASYLFPHLSPEDPDFQGGFRATSKDGTAVGFRPEATRLAPLAAPYDAAADEPLLAGLEEAIMSGEAGRLLEAFGLRDVRHRPVFAMSTGEARKMLIMSGLLVRTRSGHCEHATCPLSPRRLSLVLHLLGRRGLVASALTEGARAYACVVRAPPRSRRPSCGCSTRPSMALTRSLAPPCAMSSQRASNRRSGSRARWR